MTLYINLHTSSGHTLSATPGHYIWASPSAADDHSLSFAQASLRTAAEVTFGEYVWVAAAKGQYLEAVQILSITKSWQQGIYNPHTPSGSILVNGVGASTMTDFLPPSMAYQHVATFVPWLLSFVFPSKVLSILNRSTLDIIAASIK